MSHIDRQAFAEMNEQLGIAVEHVVRVCCVDWGFETGGETSMEAAAAAEMVGVAVGSVGCCCC